jgi:hypothetical protein
MLVVSEKVSVSIQGKGAVELRRPTTEEWNKFNAEAYPTLRGSRLVSADAVKARVELFDALVTGFRDITHPDGSVFTLSDRDRFPVEWKTQIIYTAFEFGESMELVKNSDGISADS